MLLTVCVTVPSVHHGCIEPTAVVGKRVTGSSFCDKEEVVL